MFLLLAEARYHVCGLLFHPQENVDRVLVSRVQKYRYIESGGTPLSYPIISGFALEISVVGHCL